MAAMAQQPSDNDPRSLHELAVDIITDIHKLATGLAHAGADPKVTQQIESTSALYSGLAKALAGGPVGQQPAAQSAAAGPPQGAPPQGAPPQAAPAGPPQGAPAAQPQMQGHPIGQGPAHGALHNAIVQAHQEAITKGMSGGR